MKHVIEHLVTCSLALALACSCSDLSEISGRIDELESRVSALETQIGSLNGNVEALQALAGGGTIVSVSQKGDTYIIETSNGSELVINQGSVGIGNAPVMSIDKDGFWMADYQDGKGPQHVLRNGEKVLAVGQDGVTPLFGVDDEDYWTVSYDGGESFRQVLGADGKPVKAIASGDAADSYFRDVKVDGDKLVLTLRNGDVYTVPVISDFYCRITCGEDVVEFKYDDAKSYPVEMSGVVSTVVTAPEGWKAVLSESSLKVTAPSDPTKATLADSRYDVSIIAFSGAGYGTVAKLHVKLSGEPSHDTPVASITAGETSITSVSFNVKAEDSTEWYYLILPASQEAPGMAEIMGSGTKCTEMTATVSTAASGELTSYTCYVLPVNGSVLGTIACATATSAAYANRYEAYQAGKAITIGGKSYDKATYGDATLINSDTSWNNSASTPGGVFFIADGVTLTCAAFRPNTSVIILGEKPGTAANFVTTGTFIPQAENLEFIFNSLNVSLQKNALLYGGKNVPLVGFYSCKIAITGSNANNFSLTATSKIINTEFIDCDIEIAANSVGIHDGSKGLNKFETIIFRNNTVYSKGSTRPFQFFRQGKASIVDAAGRIEIRNNTFYDITFTSNGLCSPKTLDAFWLENNIFAYSGKFDSYQRCLWMSGDDDQPKTGPVAGYPATGKISGNIKYNTERVLGCMRPDERLSWYESDYQEVTLAPENPFSNIDLDKGILTTKSAYSNCGAHR